MPSLKPFDAGTSLFRFFLWDGCGQTDERELGMQLGLFHAPNVGYTTFRDLTLRPRHDDIVIYQDTTYPTDRLFEEGGRDARFSEFLDACGVLPLEYRFVRVPTMVGREP